GARERGHAAGSVHADTVERRGAVCAGAVFVFAAAAAEPEPVYTADRARRADFPSRRMRDVPHATALYEQQADACRWVYSDARATPRRCHSPIRWHRHTIDAAVAKGDRILS